MVVGTHPPSKLFKHERDELRPYTVNQRESNRPLGIPSESHTLLKHRNSGVISSLSRTRHYIYPIDLLSGPERSYLFKHISNAKLALDLVEASMSVRSDVFARTRGSTVDRTSIYLTITNGRASSESSEDGAGSSASTSRGAGSYGSGCAGGWRSVFGAVSGRELRLYECAPWSPEAWASPSITCPLIATRLVSSSTKHSAGTEAASSSSPSPHTQYGATFAVRVGTIEGVVTHTLRAETRRDLAAWARAIVQGCHSAAHSLREYTVRCVWQGRPCQLVVHHEDGFALFAAGTRGITGNGIGAGAAPAPLWRRSFEQLKMSADDGARLLWLDFVGDDTEIELDLESCPKPIVFVLHNFLSAKIHRLGLGA
ncbi:hypothetical protein QAD02_024033 [Eretmocerus hayati]|uniref:Uncharacterized protein n=1 Tax=Eretmocerus hayati TaxID=131215 RepID=A0ACC2PXM8_9HYME|nr:hypothetical protein QAD02_024033 [Eretmocerus hayati]